MIEPHIFLILGVLLPFYLIFGSTFRSFAMHRVVVTCWVIGLTGILFLLGSVFAMGNKPSWLIVPALIDTKCWFLLWMMPVTVIYIHDRGLDRWLRHFFIATACFCVLTLIVRATPLGWGKGFLPETDWLGRITSMNDILLVLAIPLVIAWMMDRGFSLFMIICLMLYVMQLFNGQTRFYMAVISLIITIILVRNPRFGRSIMVIFIGALGLFVAFMTLPYDYKAGLIDRLTDLGTQSEIYMHMLATSQGIALAQLGDSPFKWLFGAGFGTYFDLYGGTEGVLTQYVDNLWITILVKVGIVGSVCISVPILRLCWGAAKGRPISNVDRVFKLWAFFMPIICIKASNLLWSTTAGVIWATLAVSTVLREQRSIVNMDLLADSDDYLPDEIDEIIATE